MSNEVTTNKDKNIRKVNTLGKVSRILLNIMLICLIIGIVCCIIGSIYVMTLPDDAVKLNGDFTGQVTVSSEIPENVIRIEEEDFSIGEKGEKVKFSVKESENADSDRVYDISFVLEKLSGKNFKAVIVSIMVLSILSAVILIVIVIFGRRLASALEKCESPFEDNVIRKMKAFGISLIPWAAFKLIVGNLGSLATVIGVLVVLLFISVFNYGAKLQKESDETL